MSNYCCKKSRNGCCCDANGGYWDHYNMMRDSFQRILDVPQRLCEGAYNSRRHSTSGAWYHHPVYRQYWEQYNSLQTNFQKLFHASTGSHHCSEKTHLKRKSGRRGCTHHENPSCCKKSENIKSKKRYKTPPMASRGRYVSGSSQKKQVQAPQLEEEMEDDSDTDIDPGFLAFKIESEQFKRERDAKKGESSNRPKSVSDFEEEDNSAKEQGISAKELYGENAPTIMAMELACELNFKHFRDTEAYKSWPNMPLNV